MELLLKNKGIIVLPIIPDIIKKVSLKGSDNNELFRQYR